MNPFPFSTLEFCRLRFHLLSHGLRLGSPSNLFHSGLGMMLKTVDAEAFDACFAPQQQGSWPRPFVMLLPAAGRRLYAPGDDFTIELTLIGNARQWAESLRQALERLGKVGIGPDRGKFHIVRVEAVGVDPESITTLWTQTDGWCEPPCGVTVAQLLGNGVVSTQTSLLELEWITPVRLKSDGGFWREAPPLAVVMARLLGRLAQLTGEPINRDFAAQIDEVARLSRILEDNSHWMEWKRRSVRQGQTIPVGGLVGSTLYGGPVAPITPWLRLGEWLHLGAKTAFGLGALRLAVG